MRKNIPPISDLVNIRIAIAYAVLIFFIRTPFFFRDYIDHDESTFILVAQAWVDGYLPYTLLWDLKPPLTFAFFSGIILLFGKSLVAIRIFGTIIILLTSYLLYLIGLNIRNHRVGLWAGILYLVLSSLFDAKQGVMSEHLCVFALIIGLYCLIHKRDHLFLFLAGLFWGTAIMTKLNIAYSVLFASIALGIQVWRHNHISAFVSLGISYIFGVILVPILTSIPYVLSGHSKTWLDANLYAPLNYSQSTQGSLPFFSETALISISIFLIVLGFWWTKRRSTYLETIAPHLYIIYALLLGVLYSFISVGKINGHYLIQAYPMLILIILAIWIPDQSITIPPKFIWVAAILFLGMMFEPLNEYYFLSKRISNGKSLFNGEGYDIAKYIKYQQDQDSLLFLPKYHITYWLLDQHPPSKIMTHPSNLVRWYNYPYMDTSMNSPEDVLKDILARQPLYIVTEDNKIPFINKNSPHHNLNSILKDTLDAHYRIETIIGRAELHRRLKP